MFTPGDNDWTDCDRPRTAASTRRAAHHERKVFFGTDNSLGEHTMKQAVQSTPNCLGCGLRDEQHHRGAVRREPALDVQERHVRDREHPGHLQQPARATGDPAGDEPSTRPGTRLTSQWLQDTFAEATAKDSVAVMIIGQADPGFDGSDATRGPDCATRRRWPRRTVPRRLLSFLTKLRDLTIAFDKPVVYVHGDSHYFRVDKPLQTSTGRRVENFTRVETFGDNAQNGNNDVHWVKALVDPNSRDVFAFQAEMVPGN